MSSESSAVVIGVAFGNCNSSIAFPSKEGKVEVIANQDGDRAIPSALAYVGEDEYHGFQAKAQLIRNGKNTVTYFRDYIGKDFKDIDPTYASGSAHPVSKDGVVGFNLVTSSAEDAEPTFVSVAEITKRHLQRITESAADFLGKPVAGAVVAVPSDFSAAQREELTKIAAEAGLNILQIIPESVASVFAYDATFGTGNKDKVVVVADFGATRSDAAVVAVRGGMYTVLASHHNYELGGLQLDKALGDYFANEFKKKHKVSPYDDKSGRATAKLLTESEITKRTLSASTTATISIESLADGYDYHSPINRLRYELSARAVIEKCGALVEEVVKQAGLDVLDIDEVVLAGGSSHTPKIASRVAAIFPETTVIQSPSTNPKAINPGESIAVGAAFQASLIAGFSADEIRESLQPVVTTAPHLAKPVGVVVDGGKFVPVLEANTAVPIRKSVVFTAAGDSAYLEIVEGEQEIVTKVLEKTAQEDEEDEDYESEEDEEVREKVVKPGKKIAEAALKNIKAGAKVEVILNIAADLKLTIAAREVGSDAAVRGEVAGNTSTA
ncbi:heat shock protein 70 family [Dipodascopsis tothii]|uniref:heat shock protein 70 family n=1 Tax=Dipodascopsis tothii TaxID=44089 RepID=UPI0034D00318